MKLLIPFLIITSSLHSQPLSISDKLPGINIGSIINYPVSEIRSSDLKGKMVVLDFFATWCASCIQALPHLDSLQQQFGDKLQVLVVTYEPAGKVEALRKKNELVRSMQLPFVTSDSVFQKLFPHKLIPHEVWIDTAGIIRAITAERELTAANISAMIAGKQLMLPLKKDVMDFDYQKPLLLDGNGGNETNLLYRSSLIKHLDGMSSAEGVTYSSDSSSKRFFYINRSSQILYLAATDFTDCPDRLILEIKDPRRFINREDERNSWCYEVTVPVAVPEIKVRQWMLQDLNRYFGLQGHFEKRKINCGAAGPAKEMKVFVLRNTGDE